MKPVLFVNIPESGLAVDLPDDSWLPESFEKIERTPVVSFLLKRREEGVHLTGTMNLVLSLQCDRCLDVFPKTVDTTFSMDLVVGSPEPMGDDQIEYICSPADLDTMFIESAHVDLDEMARQQLYLQLPVKNICTVDCPGLCQCGEKQGSDACTCEKRNDSPFAALAKLGATKQD